MPIVLLTAIIPNHEWTLIIPPLLPARGVLQPTTSTRDQNAGFESYDE